MNNTLKVTVADVRNLLADDRDDPVLYVTEEGELDVWVEAYVPDHQRVARRHEVQDVLLPKGADPLTEEDIRGYLPGLQREVDQVVGALAS
ncbi:hypothetical protein ABZ234_08635 [Nocardiopsis sp. NPDC006198]|uniref:hypothetical protein n=1 Tax=Nocardiopsis sp. NPDC006198 TaxID=3154472 RepID=UPI0033BFB74F